MFHALPAYLREDVEAELGRLAEHPPVPVRVVGVFLTRQDAQPFRPHVTVQNKADPEVALRRWAVDPPAPVAVRLAQLRTWRTGRAVTTTLLRYCTPSQRSHVMSTSRPATSWANSRSAFRARAPLVKSSTDCTR